MKLNLKQVLALADIQKPRFDSNRRRGLYGHMYEARDGSDSVAEYENARNRFGIEHVVALVCIENATAKGISLEAADSVVSNNFGQIAQAISEGSIDPELQDDTVTGSPINHFFVGAIYHVVGKGHYAGPFGWFHDQVLSAVVRSNETDAHISDAPSSVLMIDVTTAYRQVKQKLLAGLGL